jgi:hypothetical protein
MVCFVFCDNFMLTLVGEWLIHTQVLCLLQSNCLFDISYKSVESHQYYFKNGFFGSCWCLNLLIPHKTVAYLYASLEFPDPMVSLTDAGSLLVTQWCFLIYFVVSVTDAMMHMLSCYVMGLILST